MLDPFVDGRNSIAGAGGPTLGFAPEREELPDDIALAYAKLLKAPPKPASFDERWSVWARAMAAATARQAIPRWSAATILARAPRAARPGSTTISRATAWWASRSPAVAPTGAWRRAWAAARAMRSRPASTARRDGARPIWPRRFPSPTIGCRYPQRVGRALRPAAAAQPRGRAHATRAPSMGARLDQRPHPRGRVPGASGCELPRQRREAGEEFRAHLGRRRISSRQRHHADRQVRRRIRKPLLHLRRHRHGALHVVK